MSMERKEKLNLRKETVGWHCLLMKLSNRLSKYRYYLNLSCASTRVIICTYELH